MPLNKPLVLDSIAIRSFIEFYDGLDSVYTHFSKADFFDTIDDLDPSLKDGVFEILLAGDLIVPHQSPIICVTPRYTINVFISELITQLQG